MGKKQERTLAKVQLQIGVTKEHERGGGIIGSLSGRCLGNRMSGYSNSIGHRIWLSFRGNCY